MEQPASFACESALLLTCPEAVNCSAIGRGPGVKLEAYVRQDGRVESPVFPSFSFVCESGTSHMFLLACPRWSELLNNRVKAYVRQDEHDIKTGKPKRALEQISNDKSWTYR